MPKPNLKAVATPPPAPPRTPERDALARAIERHATAQRARDAIGTAEHAAFRMVGDAGRAVEAATAAVEVAKRNAAEYATTALLEQSPAPAVTQTTRAARVALAEAEDGLAAALAAQAALPAKREAASTELFSARRALDACLRDVVRSSPAVARVIAEYNAARASFVASAAALDFLDSLDVLPPGWSVDAPPPDDAPWRLALAALESDADAPLPE
jgi:hypothetical protein